MLAHENRERIIHIMTMSRMSARNCVRCYHRGKKPRVRWKWKICFHKNTLSNTHTHGFYITKLWHSIGVITTRRSRHKHTHKRIDSFIHIHVRRSYVRTCACTLVPSPCIFIYGIRECIFRTCRANCKRSRDMCLCRWLAFGSRKNCIKWSFLCVCL